MQKLIIIVGVILVLGILITTAYFWYSRNKLVGTGELKENTAPKIIGEKNNEIKKAKNNALSKIIETNQRGDTLIINKLEYQILYLKDLDRFLISILERPFEEIKKGAEEEFLQITKADKETVCRLNVVVTTPRFVNPDLAGRIFYLGFCETRTP